jgi:hypothetical protein
MARFVSNPSMKHWRGVQRIIQYLKGTNHHGIVLGGIYNQAEMFQIYGYSDADWAGSDDRKSTSGHVLFMGPIGYGSPISWESKRQSVIALSTYESELISMVAFSQVISWCRMFCVELGFGPNLGGPSTMFGDNQSAIFSATQPTNQTRAKHIDIKWKYLRDRVLHHVINIVYIASEDNVADIFTKALPFDAFSRFREELRVMEGM